jgi:hypothetical protein
VERCCFQRIDELKSSARRGKALQGQCIDLYPADGFAEDDIEDFCKIYMHLLMHMF